jgi:hypothetical protein
MQEEEEVEKHNDDNIIGKYIFKIRVALFNLIIKVRYNQKLKL